MAARSTTAPVSETPSETRRCELWSRPPWAIDRPSSSRTIVTRVVSRIGTASTSTDGTIRWHDPFFIETGATAFLTDLRGLIEESFHRFAISLEHVEHAVRKAGVAQ